MIRAGIPGLYLFHRGEERGGVGSYHIADTSPDLLHGITHAIAFDRKAEHSIITHQMGQRCCSSEFAHDLSDRLKMSHVADPTGSFTDTAAYIHLIPECTNVSAGYYNEHTRTETLNIAYALRLQRAILQADLSALAVSHTPASEPDLWSTLHDSYGLLDDYHSSSDTLLCEICRWYITALDAYEPYAPGWAHSDCAAYFDVNYN
jgi:hypothetical protein